MPTDSTPTDPVIQGGRIRTVKQRADNISLIGVICKIKFCNLYAEEIAIQIVAPFEFVNSKFQKNGRREYIGFHSG
jgi:hypothetical protein